ncbi:MAG: dTDP-4-amino-4,6-dideoxygalactose transaminase [Bryobacterales bacterium]|nr:dTDP-4-amino-4,6-dideoxygalactose transaminase [Bryobacterales bacterium]
MQTIPFNQPTIVGKELYYIAQAIQSGHASGDGEFSKKCQRLLEEVLGVRRVLLTTSCTDALEMAALLLDIEPGDEVIVPSFTFVSTVNAFVLRGAKPVFVDIRPDTLNMDERMVKRLITPNTKAILPVHYGGVGCAMDEICGIASEAGIAVVEDNAHGLFGKYKGRNLGSFGAMGTQSFHETKNVSCGEGGALLINEERLVERAEIIREKGTNRSQFFRGAVDKYTWVDLGSSFLPSEILAAFLYAQLEAREEIQAKRSRIWHFYREQFAGWAEEANVRLPYVPEACEQSFHLFYLLFPTPDLRDAMLTRLRQQGITSVFHYLPLHLSPMARRLGIKAGDCEVTESVSGRLLRLPFYNDLSESDQLRVVGAVKETWKAIQAKPVLAYHASQAQAEGRA